MQLKQECNYRAFLNIFYVEFQKHFSQTMSVFQLDQKELLSFYY